MPFSRDVETITLTETFGGKSEETSIENGKNLILDSQDEAVSRLTSGTISGFEIFTGLDEPVTSQWNVTARFRRWNTTEDGTPVIQCRRVNGLGQEHASMYYPIDSLEFRRYLAEATAAATIMSSSKIHTMREKLGRPALHPLECIPRYRII